jgi:hypothetical protein
LAKLPIEEEISANKVEYNLSPKGSGQVGHRGFRDKKQVSIEQMAP